MGGNTIKLIRERSGAKISIGEPIGVGHGAEQVVSLTGSLQALEYVLAEINKQVQMLSSEPWFLSWASSTCAAPQPQLPGGGYQPSIRGASTTTGLDVMMRVAQSLPPYVMEDIRGFAVSCVVPNKLVGGLIGRGGSGTKEVQMQTGTKIAIREIHGDPDHRSLNITGPLSNTCAAYMLMMKRYLDAEYDVNRSADGAHVTEF